MQSRALLHPALSALFLIAPQVSALTNSPAASLIGDKKLTLEEASGRKGAV
ncbi:MAG: hypothetical protein ACI841_002825, partial [Planctomycetota bacterium]